MTLEYTGLNWVAVIAGAVAIIVVGFIWYLPQVFGTRWAALSGRPLPSLGEVSPMTYVGGIVVALITAYVLAVVMDGLGAATLVDGATVGFLAWLGFVAATTYAAVLFEGRSTAHWAINAGNVLVGLVVAGAIMGYLRPA